MKLREFGIYSWNGEVMLKYEINDVVLYGLSGACVITEIGTLSFAGPDKIYYSLKPLADNRSTIYVPVTKEADIIRKVINKAEGQKIIDALNGIECDNSSITRDACDPIIKSGDNLAVAKLIKNIRNLRKENKKIHKTLNIQEERILQDAERVFFSELAAALDMPMNEAVLSYMGYLDSVE